MTLTGANVAFGKAIAGEVSVYVFVLFRFAVASAALALIARGEPGPRLAEMTAGQWRDLTLMALLGMVGFTVLMFEGLRRTAAADAGIITAALPAVVALLGVALAGDRLSRSQLAAVGLAVAGLLLVQATGASGGVTTLSAICWWQAPCCARRASFCSASGWRRPTGRCGWRSAPIWQAWC